MNNKGVFILEIVRITKQNDDSVIILVVIIFYYMKGFAIIRV